jgi:hypothetical protein
MIENFVVFCGFLSRDPALKFRSSALGVAIWYKIALARVNGSFSLQEGCNYLIYLVIESNN